MSKLFVTVNPIDSSGNALTGLDLRLRKTGSTHGDTGNDYTGTVISLTETPANSGKYISSAINDTVDIATPDNSALGNYELWKYVSGSPDSLMADNYMIGVSIGLINQLKTMQTSIDGKAASSHDHDTRYYTESEVDSLLAGKAASSHTHDDRYYTESETDNLLAGKAASSHTHDDRYYTESEMDAMLKINTDLPKPHVVSTGNIDFIGSDGITDTSLLAVPVKAGMVSKDVLLPITVAAEMSNGIGNASGEVLDMGNDIYADSAALTADSNNLVGAFLVLGGTWYEIVSVVWDSSAIAAKFSLKGSPDLSAYNTATVVPVVTGHFYEIDLLPKFSGTTNPAKLLKYVVPAFVDGVFQKVYNVPVEMSRDYKVEVRSIQHGVRSAPKSLASVVPTFTQGSSSSNNLTLTSSEFGLTVELSKNGGWANADSFEVCWNVGTSASFDDISHRKTITYSTKLDIPLSDSLYVTVGARPLRNGVVIAPAVYDSLTSGAGGALPNEKSFHVDVSLTNSNTTQAARTVLQKAFRNPVEILQATFVASGASGDTSKFRVFQSNVTSNIASGQFDDDKTLNMQYSAQLGLKIDEQATVYEITVDFFDDAVGADNAKNMAGRLEIFYRDRTTQKQTVNATLSPPTYTQVNY